MWFLKGQTVREEKKRKEVFQHALPCYIVYADFESKYLRQTKEKKKFRVGHLANADSFPPSMQKYSVTWTAQNQRYDEAG